MHQNLDPNNQERNPKNCDNQMFIQSGPPGYDEGNIKHYFYIRPNHLKMKNGNESAGFFYFVHEVILFPEITHLYDLLPLTKLHV